MKDFSKKPTKHPHTKKKNKLNNYNQGKKNNKKTKNKKTEMKYSLFVFSQIKTKRMLTQVHYLPSQRSQVLPNKGTFPSEFILFSIHSK